MKTNKICENCGKEYITQGCWLKRHKHHYCTDKCARFASKGKPRGKKHQVVLVCVYCSKKFFVPFSLRNTIKFCNSKCRKQYSDLHSLIRLRHKSITQKEAYNNSFYKQWRDKVFAKDRYTCQWCNAHNGNGKDIYLEAHHIKSWKCFPELRFDMENGITLCLDCHNTTRGNGERNKMGQFIENKETINK